MRITAWPLVAALLMLLVVPPTVRAGDQDDTVWTTRGRCSGARRIRVTIAYDEKPVYRGVLSLCQNRRSELPDSAPRVSRFYFFGAPRDLAPTSAYDQSRQIEGRVWELSADHDGVRLGLAFAAGADILLNTNRVVAPATPSTDTLAAGLVVRFDPPLP